MGVAFFGEAVEGTRSDVEVGVSGREYENENAGISGAVSPSKVCGGEDEGYVQKAGKGADAALDDGDYKRGSGRPGRLLGGEGQALGIVGDEHADEEDGQDVEDDDAPEGQLDGLGDNFSRILCFTDGHTHKLCT